MRNVPPVRILPSVAELSFRMIVRVATPAGGAAVPTPPVFACQMFPP